MRHGEVYLPNGINPDNPEAANKFLILLTDPDTRGQIIFGITKKLCTPDLVMPGCHETDYYIEANARNFPYRVGITLDDDNICQAAIQSMEDINLRKVFTISGTIIEQIHHCAKNSQELSKAIKKQLCLPSNTSHPSHAPSQPRKRRQLQG